MYKMDQQLKEELSGCDYYTAFVKDAIKKLKTEGICYAYYPYQVEEIKKYIDKPVKVIDNDWCYTISIDRKYRKVVK